VKYAWIDAQRKDFGLDEMCAVLDVSESGYRSWKHGGKPHRRRLTDAQMLTLIQSIHAEFKGAYGSPRMVRELRLRGFPASKERVERLMRENGIKAKHKRRFKVTTDSKHNLPVAPNLLERNFTPDAPNQVWTSDITYLWTDEGWLYLAIVIDLFNREVVGWSLKPRMTADIVTDALTMAWFRRKPAAGLIHHSDRGSQYASHAFQAKLAGYGMICSMSRKGDCWDNAPTESWFGSFKNERVYGERFETRDEVIAMAFEYIEVFYNRKRLHSTLDYKSPMQFLSDWINAQQQRKLVA
jgi:transposase InsO family protein